MFSNLEGHTSCVGNNRKEVASGQRARMRGGEGPGPRKMHLQGSPGTQREPSQRTLVSRSWKEALCLQEKELRFEATEGWRQLGKTPKLEWWALGGRPRGRAQMAGLWRKRG